MTQKSRNKTVATEQSAQDYVQTITPAQKREDSLHLLKMMARVTGAPAIMWGGSMIGFGQYHYKYESGREGDFFMTGFAPRKANIAIYIMPGFKPFPEQMEKLGKYKTGKSCLYVNKLKDVDLDVLEDLVRRSYEWMEQKYH